MRVINYEELLQERNGVIFYKCSKKTGLIGPYIKNDAANWVNLLSPAPYNIVSVDGVLAKEDFRYAVLEYREALTLLSTVSLAVEAGYSDRRGPWVDTKKPLPAIDPEAISALWKDVK